MDIRDETTMLREDNDQYSEMEARVLKHSENSLKIGEQIEQRILSAALERVRKEQMHTLETEWADHKDLWEQFLQEGKTPREVLDFLESFA